MYTDVKLKSVLCISIYFHLYGCSEIDWAIQFQSPTVSPRFALWILKPEGKEKVT